MNPGRKHKAETTRIPLTTFDESSVRENMKATPAEAKLWQEAIDAELATLRSKGTWTEISAAGVN